MYRESIWKYSKSMGNPNQHNAPNSAYHTQDMLNFDNTIPKSRPKQASLAPSTFGNRASVYPDLRSSLPPKPIDSSPDIIEIPHNTPSYELAALAQETSPEKYNSWISDRPTSVSFQASDSQCCDDTPTLLAYGIRERRVSAYMKFL
ncbi:hypothetical protein DSO57_1019769 [Entomophthora muscae]|uniref:Uncharacterized protein n=1 Tax=Entomophthora muscae TaxID=34485 RepID=A0ACC2TF15_9FUNG|nr:hypothetical protein DSO57_1019769 [Entomophthora muscae]